MEITCGSGWVDEWNQMSLFTYNITYLIQWIRCVIALDCIE